MFLVVAASPASRCAWQKGSAHASSLRLLHGFPLFLRTEAGASLVSAASRKKSGERVEISNTSAVGE